MLSVGSGLHICYILYTLAYSCTMVLSHCYTLTSNVQFTHKFSRVGPAELALRTQRATCSPSDDEMGCCMSGTYGPPPLLTEVKGGFTDGIGEITTRRTGYVLECETHGIKATTPWGAYFVRYGGANKVLDIKDDAGRVVYKIMPHGQPQVTNRNYRENSLGRMKMHFVDGTGTTKLLVLERKFHIGGHSGVDVAADGEYYFYTYSPSFEGQASTTVDNDGAQLYPYAWAPDPEIKLPLAIGEREPLYHVKRFKTSNDKADSVTVLRYKRLETSPFRMAIKSAEGSVGGQDEYDRTILATAAADKYLMSISAGAGADGKYFTWTKEFDSKTGKRDAQWGVDCAAGMDSLLVIAIVVSSGCNGMGDARGSIGATTLWAS